MDISPATSPFLFVAMGRTMAFIRVMTTVSVSHCFCGIKRKISESHHGHRPIHTGKPAAAFTSGGGFSNSALLSIERMISSFKLQKVAEGVVSQGAPNENDLAACKKLGEALAKAAIKRVEAPKN